VERLSFDSNVAGDIAHVCDVATFMRVSEDRVHRWTSSRARPIIPYYREGGRKVFCLKGIEGHIRRRNFCPVKGVDTPFPLEEFSSEITYPKGIGLLWTREFGDWVGLTKTQIDLRVRRGEFPFFQFGGIRLWDPALVLEARESRLIRPL
jgi:hypothetical protein